MRQHSICYHNANVYNKFGIYIYACYISLHVELKKVFIMNEISFLKVGGAGDGGRPQHLANDNTCSPAKLCA